MNADDTDRRFFSLRAPRDEKKFRAEFAKEAAEEEAKKGREAGNYVIDLHHFLIRVIRENPRPKNHEPTATFVLFSTRS